MATPGDRPRDRIDELLARIEGIERFLAGLGYRATPPAPRATVEPLQATQPSFAAPTASPGESDTLATMNALKRAAMERRAVEPIPPDTDRGDPSVDVPFAEVVAEPPPPPQPPPPLPLLHPPTLPMGTRRPDPATHLPTPTLEQAIGLKVAGWIGAIVLVIGGAMGVKYAYDQGWLGGLSDEMKLGLLYAIGIAIIGVGEFVHRRVAPLAAVGIFGAGVAMLFVVGYAGNAYYGLYEQHIAFGLMAGACAIGFVIALRGRLVSIALLSLIGANVAPLVLRQSTTGEASLLIYLLILQVLAVALAHVGRDARWWVLRTLSLIMTSLWMTARLLESDTAHSMLTIEFAIAYALVYQFELVLAAWRRPPTGAESLNRFSLAAFSFVVTSLCTAAFLLWSRGWAGDSRALAVVGLAGAALAAGGLGWRPRTRSVELRKLVESWFVQAGTLLFIAIPIALAGPWLTIGWAILGVGYAVLGRIIRRSGPIVAGMIAWIVALVWLVGQCVQQPHGAMFVPLTTIIGTQIPTWFGVALVIVASGHAVSLLSPRRLAEGNPTRAAIEHGDLVAILATAAALVATLAALPSLGATGLLIAFAWLLFAISAASRRESYVWQSLGVSTVAAAHWLAIDVIVERLSATWSARAQIPFLNETMGVGLLAVGSAAAIAWLSVRRHGVASARQASIRFGIAVAMLVVFTIALSIEVERAVDTVGSTAWPPRQLVMFGWTILWLTASLLVVPLARVMRLRDEADAAARHATAILIAAITLKFVVVDSLFYAFTTPRVAALVFFNAHTVTGAFVVASLVTAWRLNRERAGAASVVRGLIPVVPLVVGSIELDRLIGPEKTLVGLSIFWGLYAIGTILAGFAVRSASFRIGGLVLLGLTLVKIVLLDLAQASTGLRILSFLGVGAILLITSVLYGKLSPLILEQLDRHRPPSVPHAEKGRAV